MSRTFDPRTEQIRKNLLERKEIQELLEELKGHHPDTYEHSERVCALSIDVALQNGLSLRIAKQIGLAALLHDFGKTHVDRAILDKAGPLTPEEFEEVRTHPRVGFVALKHKVPESVRRIVISHHEFKSNGYPRAKRDERRRGVRKKLSDRRDRAHDERLLAQIVAIVDAFDALSAGRPYQKPMTETDVRRIIQETFKGSKVLVGQVMKRYAEKFDS
jgi:putative nucleotidyltransferase with HDIG domain